MRLGSHYKKALILSDMFGVFNDTNQYVNYLHKSEIFFTNRGYDVCISSSPNLAGITKLSAEKMHKQFLDSGIDCASDVLARNNFTYDLAIGFSVGGTILWKSCQKKTDLIKNLVCISSTRLRYETEKIKPKTHLIYGVDDPYSPAIEILEKISDLYTIIPNAKHDFYLKSAHVEKFKID